MNQYLGPAILVGAILFVLWRRKEQQKAAQRGQAQPVAQPTVIYQTSGDQQKTLLQLHYEHQVEREAEIKRDLIKRRLDQATLEHEALVQINRIVSPVPTSPPDAPKS